MNLDDPRADWPGLDSRFNMTWRSWHDDAPRPWHNRLRAESDGRSETPDQQTGHTRNGNGAAPALPTDRVATLRRWIAEGGHNDPDVAEKVARRILENGDL